MKVAPLALAFGCLAAGAAIGLLLGKNSAPQPLPVDGSRSAATDGAVLAELRDLSARVARLHETVAALRIAPQRLPAPMEADTQPAPSEDVDALVDRLTQLAERFAGLTSNHVNEALRVARHHRPQPDVAAAEALATRLRDSQVMGYAEHLAVQREWLLCGMDEVVQRLGMPSSIGGEAPGEFYWSYQRPDGDEVVTFHFRDGLVVSVKEE